MLHVVLMLACLCIFVGVFFSIRAAILRKAAYKRARNDAVDAYGVLLSRDVIPYARPDGFVILSGGRAFTNLNHNIEELSFFGKNSLTDDSYPYFMIGNRSEPGKDAYSVLYPFKPAEYDVYVLPFSDEENLYLWLDPDGDVLSRSGGAELYEAAKIISPPEKTEYDYNVRVGDERDGKLEDALCRVTDENGAPPDALTVTFSAEGITLTVKDPADRITAVTYNTGASLTPDAPAQSVTVPLAFLLSVPTTPVYPNDLAVAVAKAE